MKMKFASLVLLNTVKGLIKKQVLLCLVFATVMFLVFDITAFLAAVYGGLISVFGAVIIAWRIRHSAIEAIKRKTEGYIQIALGVVQKFIGTILLFAFGIGWLELSPPIMIVSFAIAQLSYLFNRVNTSYLQNV